MKFGINWDQPSTWRGVVLLATVAITAMFHASGADNTARDVFLGGLAAVGAIGLGVHD